jgi:hypothetical protein
LFDIGSDGLGKYGFGHFQCDQVPTQSSAARFFAYDAQCCL